MSASTTASVPTTAAHLGTLRTVAMSVGIYLVPGWVTGALLVWQVPAVAEMAARIAQAG